LSSHFSISTSCCCHRPPLLRVVIAFPLLRVVVVLLLLSCEFSSHLALFSCHHGGLGLAFLEDLQKIAIREGCHYWRLPFLTTFEDFVSAKHPDQVLHMSRDAYWCTKIVLSFYLSSLHVHNLSRCCVML
jgi:hypothetical protein